MTAFAEQLPFEGYPDLHLSLITETDADTYRELFNANPDMISPHLETREISPYRAQRIVDYYAEQTALNMGMPYFIAEADEVVGVAILNEHRGVFTEAEYAVAGSHRGRGLAAAAVGQLLTHATGVWGLERAGLYIEQNNTYSQQVAKDLGAIKKNQHTTTAGGHEVVLQFWEKQL